MGYITSVKKPISEWFLSFLFLTDLQVFTDFDTWVRGRSSYIAVPVVGLRNQLNNRNRSVFIASKVIY